MEAEKESLVIEVTLKKSNIFNYRRLQEDHLKQINQSLASSAPTDLTTEPPLIDKQTSVITTQALDEEIIDPRPKSKFNIDDEYEDDFIDDSDIIKDTTIPIWEYGFFCWKGDVLDFKDTEKLDMNQDITSKGVAHVIKRIPVREEIVAEEEEMDVDADQTLANPNTDATKAIDPKVSDPKSDPKPKAKVSKKSTGKKKASTKKSISPVKPEMAAKVLLDVVEGGKDISMWKIPMEVIQQLKKMEQQAILADFSVKKIFPPALKDLYAQCVIKAMDYQVDMEEFYRIIGELLPYNGFTLKKLAAKLVFSDRILTFKGDLALEYKSLEINILTSLNDNPIESQENKKFKFDEEMKTRIWNILCLEWELADMDNTLSQISKQPPGFIEQHVRTTVYKKIVMLWTAGTMDTTTISSIYSGYRKRREKKLLHGYRFPEMTEHGLIRADPFSKVKKSASVTSAAATPVVSKRLAEKRKSSTSDLGSAIKKAKILPTDLDP